MDRSHEIGYRRILAVRFSRIIGLDRFELGHVLGADQRGLVAEAAGGLEELAFVAAGGLGVDGEAVQSGLAGQAGKPAQEGFDRAGSVRDLVFDAAGGGIRLVLSV
jgi:hypothetical protein